VTPLNATLHIADFEKSLAAAGEAGGADLVFTSPPYCDARTYGNDVSWTLEDYARLGDAVFKSLKPGGHCILNVDAPVRKWRKDIGSERGFHPWKIMIDWGERVGFRVPDRLAFARFGSPGAYGGRFRNDWEPLLWFQRPGAEGYFDKKSVAVDSNTKNRFVAGTRTRSGVASIRKGTGWAVNNQKRHRGTLWEYGNIGTGRATHPALHALDHPATFPYALASDVIQCFSPEGGLVVDPFFGCGTTPLAALTHKRNFIGSDLYNHKDGTPWADKVKETLDSLLDPGAFAMFGGQSAPDIRVVRKHPSNG
jgi:DNA modification methylase